MTQAESKLASSKTHWLLSPVFWVLILALSLIAGIVGLKLLSNLTPTYSIALDMTREEALSESRRLQRQLFPELDASHSASEFRSHSQLRNYVELEGGGPEVLREYLGTPDATAYRWLVRLFSPQQSEELSFEFSPAGEPLGFSYTMTEAVSGPALESRRARELAEREAGAIWGVRLDDYAVVGADAEMLPNGRRDHRFYYHHKTQRLGEAIPTIVVQVQGDRLTELRQFYTIPATFAPRFEQMRSINDGIYGVSTAAALLLFGLCGLVAGLWLYRRKALRFRPAFKAAAFVASGMAAAALAGFHSLWIDYDTRYTAGSFIIEQAFSIFRVHILWLLALFATFVVAEGLSRRAFAGHPRVFVALRPAYGASPQLVGRTLGGYVGAGVLLLYAVLFGLAVQQIGWWSPGGLEASPNILANSRPALEPIFTALKAATWEEALFRAIPLSAAVLVGRHLGRLKFCVTLTLIVQALIFAGVHANYPQLPGYYRLVELFVPAVVFGLVFLRFGLIPVIVWHFIYDLVLMSAPIFAAGTELMFDRALVVGAGLLPVGILLWAHWRRGAWQTMPESGFNGHAPAAEAGAQAAGVDVDVRAIPKRASATPRLSSQAIWPLAMVAVLLAAIGWWLKPQAQLPLFGLDRSQAVAKAEQLLAEKGIALTEGWKVEPRIRDTDRSEKRFVWYNAGEDAYKALLGSYLLPPHWEVRYRHFGGAVESRSQSHRIRFMPDGELLDFSVQRPPSESDTPLSEAQMAERADAFLRQQDWPPLSTLSPVRGDLSNVDGQQHWQLTLADPRAFDQDGGRALIELSFQGEAISSYRRSIQAPERHQRESDELDADRTLFKLSHQAGLGLLFGLALWGLFRQWRNHRFLLRPVLPIAAFSVSVMLLTTFVFLPTTYASFSVSADWGLQWWSKVGRGSVLALLLGLATMLLVQPVYNTRAHTIGPKRDLAWGLTLAVLWVGLHWILEAVLPKGSIAVAETAGLESKLPWLAAILSAYKEFWLGLLLLGFGIGLSQIATTKVRVGLVVLGAGVWAMAQALDSWHPSAELLENVLLLAAGGLMMYLARHKDYGVALGFIGFMAAVRSLELTQALYATAWLHGLLACAVWSLLSVGFVWHWHRRPRE